MGSILMVLHLPSHVILDMFWIQVVLDLKSQLTAYLQDFGVFILHRVGLVMTCRWNYNLYFWIE